MILFIADRLAAAHTDIVNAYRVNRTVGDTRGQILFAPVRIVDFRIALRPEHMRGYRNYTYVVLPSAALNPDLWRMIEIAKASGATEESYSVLENSA